jgi:hypothetical protein
VVWWFEKKCMKCVSGELQLECQEVSRHGVSQVMLTLCLVQFSLRTAHIQGQARFINAV